MTDSWDDMKRTKEEEYFERHNREKLEKLKGKKTPQKRICPVDGTSLECLTVNRIEIDRCPTCHGVWLDAGELEHMIKASKEASKGSPNWLTKFYKDIFGK